MVRIILVGWVLLAAAAVGQAGQSQTSHAGTASANKAAGKALPPEIARRVERQVRQFAGADADAVVTIGAPTPSEFAGFSKVPVTLAQRGAKKNFDFYLSKDSKRLLYINSFDVSQDPYARVMRQIDLSGRPQRGNASGDAPVTIVVYDDYQCPFCARFHVTLMNRVMGKYRHQARVVTKDFPITDTHPWARHAAVDANCLAAQSGDTFWAFADAVHTNLSLFNKKYDESSAEGETVVAGSSPRFNALDQLTVQLGQQAHADDARLRACIAANDQLAIDRSIAEGTAIGFGATPGIVVNGEELDGALTDEQLDAAIERALSDANAEKASTAERLRK